MAPRKAKTAGEAARRAQAAQIESDISTEKGSKRTRQNTKVPDPKRSKASKSDDEGDFSAAEPSSDHESDASADESSSSGDTKSKKKSAKTSKSTSSNTTKQKPVKNTRRSARSKQKAKAQEAYADYDDLSGAEAYEGAGSKTLSISRVVRDPKLTALENIQRMFAAVNPLTQEQMKELRKLEGTTHMQLLEQGEDSEVVLERRQIKMQEQLDKHLSQLFKLDHAISKSNSGNLWAITRARNKRKAGRIGGPLILYKSHLETWKLDFVATKGEDRIRFSVIHLGEKLDVADEQQVEAFAEAIEILLNSPYYATSPPVSGTTKRHLVHLALDRVLGTLMPLPTPRWDQLANNWGVPIWFMDATSHEFDKIIVKSGIGYSGTEVSIPGERDFFTGKGGPIIGKVVNEDGSGRWDSQLTEGMVQDESFKGTADDVPRLRRREHFLQFQSHTWTGVAANKKDFRTLLQEHASMFEDADSRGRKRQIRASDPIPGLIHAYKRSGALTPILHVDGLSAVQRLFGLPSPTICILMTCNALWIAWIWDQVRTAYDSTNNLQEAIIVLLQAADTVRAAIYRGEDPTEYCHCSAEDRLTAHHTCRSCLRWTRCMQLTADEDGIGLCAQCAPSYEQPEAVPLGDAAFRPRLLRILKTDFKGYGIDMARMPEMLEPLINSLEQQQIGHLAPMYLCGYAGPQRQRGGRSAFNWSIEAVLPYGRFEDGTLLAHTFDNSIVAQIWFNYGKGLRIVGILHEVAIWLRSDQGEEARTRLLERADQLHRVGITFEPQRARRVQTLSEEEYAAIRSAWVSGKPNDDTVTDDQQYHFFPKKSLQIILPCEWSLEQRERYVRILRQINEDIVDLSGDGSPWFLPLGPRPKWWTWDTCWTFYHLRLERMTKKCNWPNKTVESEATLLLELGFQLDAKIKGSNEKYTSLFNLPMNLWARSSLDVSYGHGIHGLPMATGWPLDPKDLSDRDDTVNNIRIETALENASRWNWLAAEWKLLPEIMSKVELPLKFYDPDMEPLPLPQSYYDRRIAEGHELKKLTPIEALQLQQDTSHDIEDITDSLEDAPDATAGLPVPEDQLFVPQGPPLHGQPVLEPVPSQGTAVTTAGLATVKATPDVSSTTAPHSAPGQGTTATPIAKTPTALASSKITPAPSTIVSRHNERHIWTYLSEGVETAVSARPTWAGSFVKGRDVPSFENYLRMSAANKDRWYNDNLMHLNSQADIREMEAAGNDIDVFTIVETDPCNVQTWLSDPKKGTALAKIVVLRKLKECQKPWPFEDQIKANKLATRIIWYYCEDGIHWIIVIFIWDPHTCRIEVYDPQNARKSREELFHFAQLMSSNIDAGIWFAKPWSPDIIHKRSPRQGNGDDCGPFSVENLRLILAKEPMPVVNGEAAIVRGQEIRFKHMARWYDLVVGQSPDPSWSAKARVTGVRRLPWVSATEAPLQSGPSQTTPAIQQTPADPAVQITPQTGITGTASMQTLVDPAALITPQTGITGMALVQTPAGTAAQVTPQTGTTGAAATTTKTLSRSKSVKDMARQYEQQAASRRAAQAQSTAIRYGKSLPDAKRPYGQSPGPMTIDPGLADIEPADTFALETMAVDAPTVAQPPAPINIDSDPVEPADTFTPQTTAPIIPAALPAPDLLLNELCNSLYGQFHRLCAATAGAPFEGAALVTSVELHDIIMSHLNRANMRGAVVTQLSPGVYRHEVRRQVQCQSSVDTIDIALLAKAIDDLAAASSSR